jgi:hypothetical protein
VEHNWTHIPGLWKLPYFHKLLVPHNIDVMHTEKMLQRPFLTLALTFQIRQKIMSKLDLIKQLFAIEHLNMVQKHGSGQWSRPRVDFCLTRPQRKEILEWFQTLKFPDGYAANLR